MCNVRRDCNGSESGKITGSKYTSFYEKNSISSFQEKLFADQSTVKLDLKLLLMISMRTMISMISMRTLIQNAKSIACLTSFPNLYKSINHDRIQVC